jgi:hypothetical protein
MRFCGLVLNKGGWVKYLLMTNSNSIQKLNESIIDIFMPEGLCATCGDSPPEGNGTYYLLVHWADWEPESAEKLLFCSEACLCKWKAGNEALRRAV